jgi:uncharacterized integral membrane protein
MTRLLTAVIATILVVAFVMMNMHVVTISLVVGPPVQIRLIYLLVTAFIIGMLSATFVKMVQRLRQRRRAQRDVD